MNKIISLYVIIQIIFLSCREKEFNTNIEKQNQFQYKLSSNPSEIELFADFFKKFKSDKKFAKNRTTLPLYMYQLDDDEINSEKFRKLEIGISEILLDQKDWKDKIIITHKSIAKDTMLTFVLGAETGLKIEYKFYLKNGLWFLLQLKDYSM